MDIIITAHILATLKAVGIDLQHVVTANLAHQLVGDAFDCSCGKEFDSNANAYYRHLTSSVAGRAKVSYGAADIAVTAIGAEAGARKVLA